MFNEPITFITGAGASKCYNLPLGFELVSQIISYLDETKANPNYAYHINSVFKHNNINVLIDDFRSRLQGSGTYSIDIFLENNPDLEEIGKLYIALAIFSAEYPGTFDTYNKEIIKGGNHWLSFIWAKMVDRVSNVDDFKKNKISFVTFNYDRTLEFFFLQRIKGFFNRDYAETIELAKTINIIHLYGDLGGYESLINVNSMGINYDMRNNSNDRFNLVSKYYNWSKRIRLMGARHDSTTFESASNLFTQSKKIYIFGFGFDDINVERLNFPLFHRSITIKSTCKGLAKGRYNKINDLIKRTNNFEFYDNTYSILDVLYQEY